MLRDTFLTLIRSALLFFSGTMISRITGLFRDVTMAAVFGCHPAVALFMTAFRSSNFFRRILGEGAMQQALVPILEKLRDDDLSGANTFFRALLWRWTFLVSALIILSESLLYQAIQHDFGGVQAVEVMGLTMVMLPSLLFICLYALNTAFLQCEGSYFVPGVAPAMFNIAWIASVVLLRDVDPEIAVRYLGVGVVAGCVLQWGVTLPQVYRALRKVERSRIQPDLSVLWKPLFLGVLGVAGSQINSLMDYYFAQYAHPSGAAFLWYSTRLQQLPIGLLAVSLSGALLPILSRAVKKEESERYRTFIVQALEKGMLVMVPVAIGMMVTASASLSIVYGRGAFGVADLLITTPCLWGYALGTVPTMGILILAPAFYAKERFHIPAIVTTLSVVVNISLNAFFIFGLGWEVASVAFATSLSAFFNFFLLCILISLQEPKIQLKKVALRTVSICIISGIAGQGAAQWGIDPTVLIALPIVEEFQALVVQGGVYLSILAVLIGISVGIKKAAF